MRETIQRVTQHERWERELLERLAWEVPSRLAVPEALALRAALARLEAASRPTETIDAAKDACYWRLHPEPWIDSSRGARLLYDAVCELWHHIHQEAASRPQEDEQEQS